MRLKRVSSSISLAVTATFSLSPHVPGDDAVTLSVSAGNAVLSASAADAAAAAVVPSPGLRCTTLDTQSAAP